MLVVALLASCIDVTLAVFFTFVPIPKSRRVGMAVHGTTVVCEAIIITITAVLLRYNLDTSFSTKTVYLILSGVCTLANFAYQMRQLRHSVNTEDSIVSIQPSLIVTHSDKELTSYEADDVKDATDC